MTTEHRTPAGDETVFRLLTEASAMCRRARRSELGSVLQIAATRMQRPLTVVCVVGEYKQGKSHVINALVGRDISTVDDDLATAAITVIGPGEQPTAIAHRSVDGERTTEEIPLDDLSRFTTETPDGEFPEGIDIVEVAIPSPLLERGLAVVDTPGVNAFRQGNGQAALDFLSYADGLVLVSDASAELSPPELRFLAKARRACPTVLVALTKVDLYPEWRRIAELNQGHLTNLGLAESLIPISSTLQRAALTEQDPDLNVESGFPRLLEALETDIFGSAHQRNRGRALHELNRVLAALRTVEQARLEGLRDPEEAEKRLQELGRAQEAVARLREASTKWMVALNDGITDLRTSLDYRLRTEIRQQLQETDRLLTNSDPRSQWDEMTEDLTGSLSTLASGIFESVREGSNQIAEQLADLIAEDVPDLALSGAIDIEELWASAERTAPSTRPGVVTSGLTVLRGGYSGMLMLSMLANLAGIAFLGPLSLGAGAVFGVKQFRDERKRTVERQRQEARTVVRQFLDQTQLELSNRIQLSVQETHRALRDHFSERIRQLSATYANATRVLQESLAADEQKRKELIHAVQLDIAELDKLAAEVAAQSGLNQ